MLPRNCTNPASATFRTALAAMGALLAVMGCSSAPKTAAHPHDEHGAKRSPGARLDPKLVLHAMKGHATVRECLQEAPPEPGHVTLAWSVSQTGKVSGLRTVTSTLSHEGALDCLTRELRQLPFGNVEAPSDATWTFVRYLEGVPTSDDENAARQARKKAKAREKRVTKAKERARLRRIRGVRDEALDQRELQEAMWGKTFDEGVRIESGSESGLAAGTVEEHVHASFQLYGHCFREGFARDASLAGIVRLRLDIGADGSVSKVTDGGSDFADPDVIACVAEGFYAMSFPRSEGPTRVRYPVIFNIE